MRIRTIKPEFFKHEGLFELEKETGLPLRIGFIGLWCAADREGRFKWEPRRIKTDILPYDDVDFAAIMECLAGGKYIVKYLVEDVNYGYIPSFKNHQIINQREAQSKLPDPSTCTHVHAHACIPGSAIRGELRETVLCRDGNKCLRCGATEDLTIDHIFPVSINGTNAPSNLRTLCRSCNSARPVAGQALLDDLLKDGLTMDDMQRMCMHVHARGEGKGREGKGKEGEGSVTRGPSVDLQADNEPGKIRSLSLSERNSSPGEIPTWEQFFSHARKLNANVPEFFLKDKFLAQESSRPPWGKVGNWYSHVDRVIGWWVSAGMPKTPESMPGNRPKPSGNGNGKPAFYQKPVSEMTEKEILAACM